jgi:hypothetical protein
LARHYEGLVARSEMLPLTRATPANENDCHNRGDAAS